MSVRESFVEQFGEDAAAAVEKAAVSHLNWLGSGQDQGSDPFKWAIAIAIGFECMELRRYREYHGITPEWGSIKAWIKTDADLASHDGSFDTLAMLSGAYKEFIA